jgi:squalene-hopene/tetraprenyl-beta-curcumene cyclase
MSSRQLQSAEGLHAVAAERARRAAAALLALQRPEGYWRADVSAGVTLEPDYILLQLWLHAPVDGRWTPPTRPLVDKAARSMLRRQLPGGGFSIFPEGPADLNATIKAYCALKLAGLAADDPCMTKAREVILAQGGIHAANSYVKLNFSFLGLFPRDCCPSVPPEMMLLPHDYIYRMSSWTRAIVIPLSIIHGRGAQRPVPDGFDLQELFLETPGEGSKKGDRRFFTWRNAFLTLDRAAKLWERHGPGGMRRKAILRAEQWILERTRYSGGLGAIYPPMLYTIMALDVLGYAPEHPDRVEAQRQFDALMIEGDDQLRFQPGLSPVRDTALASFAVGESGFANAQEDCRTGDWLLSKEVRRPGDWSVKRPKTEPSGWYAQFANEFYPNIDDTALVLLGLEHAQASNTTSLDASIKRAVQWLLAMQSKNGGWAAFDVDNSWKAVAEMPFAERNAMLDLPCPDITGRVLEALCRRGVPQEHPSIVRGVDYLIRTQEQDGSWYGRWGVDYVYGTFLALRGLQAAGVSDREAAVLRGGEWLRAVQNADGGWGESCESYSSNTFIPAPSTPSQTAWAILGLIAGGDDRSSSLQKGIEHLIRTQRADGQWEEELATGTGFPGVFYLSYDLYRNSFPLLALSSYSRRKREVA